MTDLQTIITLVVCASVILAIAFDVIDMVLAALLGVSILIVAGSVTQQDILNAVSAGGGALTLLFGGMVVARTLRPTGLFENIGTRFLLLTRGSGKGFLLGIIALVAPICAFLPNATTVILVAPIIISAAVALETDFVGPLVLTSIISNSAGLLTLVGDPATFIVGSSIGLTFTQYLQRVSLGGLLAVLIIIPILPLVLGKVWRVQRELPANLQPKPIERRGLCALSLVVLAVMIVLFLFGEDLPTRIVPPAVAIIAASLALLVIYGAKVEPIDRVLRDVDWKTLVFIFCLFCLVEEFTKTGVLKPMARNLHAWFGVSLLPIALVMLGGVALASTVLANIPVVAAVVVLTKGYFVVAQLMPEQALGALYTEWPLSSLPVFVGMMFGGTLGGNATLIGASANIVSAGICAAHGKPVTFGTFMRYGVPITICQLAVSAVYVLVFFYVVGR
jgi:Na+/H+ antiporter NhaD/arsenite permease-like protein